MRKRLDFLELCRFDLSAAGSSSELRASSGAYGTQRRIRNGAAPPNERIADLAAAHTPKPRYVDRYKRRGRLYHAVARFSAAAT